MKIKINNRYGSSDIIVEAENVKIVETISHTIYGKKEDGKVDFTKRLGDDIDDDVISQFTSVMDDMAYYRESPFDSSSLIETLFDKLPEEKKKELLDKLYEKT